MKTIKELEKELESVEMITIFEQRDAKRFDIFARIETLKDVLDLIDEKRKKFCWCKKYVKGIDWDCPNCEICKELKKEIEGE